MLMHLAVPDHFDPVICPPDGITFDEMSENQIRDLWAESFTQIDERTMNVQFLASLKSFFKDKSLEFSPVLRNIFQAV